jgi:hypothetical protein
VSPDSALLELFGIAQNTAAGLDRARAVQLARGDARRAAARGFESAAIVGSLEAEHHRRC